MSERSSAEKYQKFCESKQEKIRLAIALEEYFSLNEQESYVTSLKSQKTHVLSFPSPEAPEKEAPEKGVPEKGVPEKGVPEKGVPANSLKSQETPVISVPSLDSQEKWRQEYAKYLKLRVRPAAEALIEADDAEKLEKLQALSPFSAYQIENCIRQAREKGKLSTLAWLLRLKKETGGFSDRDFSL